MNDFCASHPEEATLEWFEESVYEIVFPILPQRVSISWARRFQWGDSLERAGFRTWNFRKNSGSNFMHLLLFLCGWSKI